MDILPHSGLGQLRFGMTMQEVRAILGQPTDISNFQPLKNSLELRDVVWNYDNGIELSFSSEDNFVLGTICTESSEAVLLGKSIVGETIELVLNKFPDFEFDDDFGESGSDYKIPKLDVSIWVVDGIVDSISVFPDYDENGEMICHQL